LNRTGKIAIEALQTVERARYAQCSYYHGGIVWRLCESRKWFRSLPFYCHCARHENAAHGS